MLNPHSNIDLGLLLVRIGVGVVFISHGWSKLLDIAMTTGFFESVGIPGASFMAWFVALIELLGGIAMIAGLWVNLSGFLLAVIMVVAITVVKIPKGGIGSAEFEFVLLLSSIGLIFSGGGMYSVDSKRKVIQVPSSSL